MKLAATLLSGLAVLSSIVYINNRDTTTQEDISLQNIPAVIVPKCGPGHSNTFRESMCDSYLCATPQTRTFISGCHNSTHFILDYSNEDYYIRNNYTQCNNDLWKQDVNEVFLNDPVRFPQTDTDAIYMEIEVSPHQQLFVKNITNNNGTLGGNYINCTESGIQAKTIVNEHRNQWNSQLRIPFKLIFGDNYEERHELRARGNFFRIDLLSGNECIGSENCYYYAMTPTRADPPNFHKPKYFTDIIFE